MPRFELHLFTISEGDEGIKSSESKAICWVKDSSDMEEIEEVSDKVISENIENNPDSMATNENRQNMCKIYQNHPEFTGTSMQIYENHNQQNGNQLECIPLRITRHH